MWNQVDGKKFVIGDEMFKNSPLLIEEKEKDIQCCEINETKFKNLKSVTKVNICFLTLVLFGIVFLGFGCSGLYYSIYDMILGDLLEFREFSPTYQIWKEPPHEVLISLYIFEAVNHEEFLSSPDPNVKLQMRQIGPIVYREHLKHVNVSHHPENDTLTYTTIRHLEFMELKNEPGILNRSVIVPNFGLLGTLSYLHDASFFVRMGFNFMLQSVEESMFMNITIYDLLWNYNSEIMAIGKKYMPFLVPEDNLGVLYTMYNNFVDKLNVKIGIRNGPENFFKMNLYNDKWEMPGFSVKNGDCNATIVDSNEGYFYPKNMENVPVINYFRKTICRIIPLHYNSTTTMHGMKVLEYVLKPESFHRLENKSADCMNGRYGFDLPNGLSDLSKCYFNFPMTLSLPHFYGMDENDPWISRFDGIKADKELHDSKIYAEPVMGVGLRQYARSQVNVLIQDLSQFPEKYHKFSNMVVPLFWGELSLSEVPPFVLFLIKFAVIYLPLIDKILPWLLIFIGIALWTISLKIPTLRPIPSIHKYKVPPEQNEIHLFEKTKHKPPKE